ncbi:hypothetical protein DMN91_013045 [Ooceraea biroi]|uniref:ER-bound oxygenase mpaB/mpaB'/Rubber oxygenase catalytic domain-containing protein n=1 Tax=Ooceraea biroi TaxID=2015173 RepID=A0A3L8D4C0_OOCBI|nr:hypothetical protein DMN91_013045 [Ooceraea biroi]
MNNADMADIQCSFLGLTVLYPKNIGIHNATDEDLDAFCHMWRCYGYFLGIADEYNFCRGSFEEIKQRTQDFYQCWIIPNLRDITPEWEHMTRCIIESMNYYSLMCMSCKTIILLTTDILNLSMSHLHGSLSYLEWIAYKSWTFIMHYAMRFSSLRILFNKMMQNMFEEAANFTPEKHEELQKRSEKQLSNFSIVD